MKKCIACKSEIEDDASVCPQCRSKQLTANSMAAGLLSLMNKKAERMGSTKAVLVSLLLFFPWGLFLMWKHKKWSAAKRWLITAAFVLLVLFAMGSDDSESTTTKVVQQPSESTQVEQTAPDESPTADNQAEDASKTTEAAYLDEMLQISNNVSSSLTFLGKLEEEPMRVFTDDEFRIEMAFNMGIIQGSYERAKEITPPAKFTQTHQKFLEGLRNYSEAMGLFANGIDNYDTELIEQATANIDQGNEFIREAAAEILIADQQAN